MVCTFCPSCLLESNGTDFFRHYSPLWKSSYSHNENYHSSNDCDILIPMSYWSKRASWSLTAAGSDRRAACKQSLPCAPSHSPPGQGRLPDADSEHHQTAPGTSSRWALCIAHSKAPDKKREIKIILHSLHNVIVSAVFSLWLLQLFKNSNACYNKTCFLLNANIHKTVKSLWSLNWQSEH